MLTDLAFLQSPPPLASESDGASLLLPQPVETIELSSFFPVLEQSLLAAPAGDSGQPAATQPVDAALLEALNGGQPLPQGGESLPAGMPTPVFTPTAPATLANLQPVNTAEAAAPVATIALPAQPAPAPTLLSASAPEAPAGTTYSSEAPDLPLPAAPVNTARDRTPPFTATMDAQAGPPESQVALDRQLPPQLAIAINQARQRHTLPAETMPLDVHSESNEPAVEEVQMRLVSTERSSLARVPSVPTINVNITRPDWQPALGQRLVWMVSNGQQRAEIKLDPPQLGRVDVQIVMQGDRAQLVFAADASGSRDLLEQSMPRLREMMSEAGIDLGDVDVAHREQQPSGEGAGDQMRSNQSDWHDHEPAAETGSVEIVSGDTALLDLFV